MLTITNISGNIGRNISGNISTNITNTITNITNIKMVIFIAYFILMVHASHRKSFLGLFFGLGSVRALWALNNGPKNFFVT